MRSLRGCCRPGCNRQAVATLTYVYSDSTAVVGPLATVEEPHSWDLCHVHALTTTAPKGWEMMRYEGGFSTSTPDEDDLTALAEAVREAGRGERPRATSSGMQSSGMQSSGIQHSGSSASAMSGPLTTGSGAPDGRRIAGRQSLREDERPDRGVPRTGRRGHLRVLPDPSK